MAMFPCKPTLLFVQVQAQGRITSKWQRAAATRLSLAGSEVQAESVASKRSRMAAAAENAASRTVWCMMAEPITHVEARLEHCDTGLQSHALASTLADP